MSPAFIPATEYAHRLGIDEIPDWLPDVSPDFLEIADALDATRDGSGYGDESVEHALESEPWKRSVLVTWALFRYFLGQPDGTLLLTPDVVDGVGWSKADALWLASVTPADEHTAPVLLRALESIPVPDLPLGVDDLARLREIVTDPDVEKRLDRLDARIAAATRPEDVLDTRFCERIAATLNRPVMELLENCALKRLYRPGDWWYHWLERMTDGRGEDVREILSAIPGHLEEHGRFTDGEDVLRGLIWFAAGPNPGSDSTRRWLIPVLAEIVLAAGGTKPARSPKLANAAVEVLYYHHRAKSVVKDLYGKVPGQALRKRIELTLEYM